VNVGLRRWWFADEHLAGIADCGFGIADCIVNPQSTVRNPKRNGGDI
jgi:hypothetical protein